MLATPTARLKRCGPSQGIGRFFRVGSHTLVAVGFNKFVDLLRCLFDNALKRPLLLLGIRQVVLQLLLAPVFFCHDRYLRTAYSGMGNH